MDAEGERILGAQWGMRRPGLFKAIVAAVVIIPMAYLLTTSPNNPSGLFDSPLKALPASSAAVARPGIVVQYPTELTFGQSALLAAVTEGSATMRDCVSLRAATILRFHGRYYLVPPYPQADAQTRFRPSSLCRATSRSAALAEARALCRGAAFHVSLFLAAAGPVSGASVCKPH